MYTVRWLEFNKKDQAVQKEKTFETNEAVKKFMVKVQGKANFYRFDASTFRG